MNEVELTTSQKLEKFEKEKLTRRQALAKFGFQAGAAAVAALTADELLRKVGKEMQRRVGDNKVAQQVAKELDNAGVAFATNDEIFLPDAGQRCIKACQDARIAANEVCITAFNNCNKTIQECIDDFSECSATAQNNYATCINNCP